MYKVEFALISAVVILSVFIIVYLRLYFFTKQRIEVARFSQRIMSYFMDFAMFNAFALLYMIYNLLPENVGDYMKQGGLPDLFEASKGTWAAYMVVIHEEGFGRLWFDLRITETWIIGISFIYITLFEILRNTGSIGRKSSETLVTKDFNGTSLKIGNILLRNLIKFTPLLMATYWMGIKGVMIYTVVLYCVHRINKKGKLPHDYLANSIVLRTSYLDN